MEEHLWFYARLKGMASNLVWDEVDRYETINLYDAILLIQSHALT